MRNLQPIDHPKLFYRDIKFTPPETVLRASESTDAWDSWGVRDAAILIDESAEAVVENGKMIMYYTGSSQYGKLQQTGRAVSQNGGKTWRREPIQPVLSPTHGEWDCSVAATPWVIKREAVYYLYYRGATEPCVDDAIGLAISPDGITFEKYQKNPILTAADFRGVKGKPTTMGVLDACVGFDKAIILLFEAVEEDYSNRGQIFAAKSQDGINFTPINEGDPIFSSRDIASWPVNAVCNPRLVPLEDGWYMLGFNGSAEGEHSIGIAFTKDFVHWDEHPQNPLLVPRGWPEMHDFTNRLEGPNFIRSEILKATGLLRCFFMAIPLGARNHEYGVNALAYGEVVERTKNRIKVLALPENDDSVISSSTSIKLDTAAESSGFVQGSHILNDLPETYSFNIKIDRTFSDDYSVCIALSDSINSIPRGFGIILKISHKMIMAQSEITRVRGLLYWVRRLTRAIKRRLIKKESLPFPDSGWQMVGVLKPLVNESSNFKIKFVCHDLIIENGDDVWTISVPQSQTGQKVISVSAFHSAVTFQISNR